MASSPLVSVIIPCFNSVEYFGQAVESVLNQSFKNIEVVIVDDGSTDGSLELARSYQSDKVKVYSQEPSGACVARNLGFKMSSGNYIQYLDADDILLPDKIENQVRQLAGREDIVSNGRWGRFYANDPRQEVIKWGPHENLRKDLDPVSWLCENHMSQTSCWLASRSLIQKAGPWDESLVQNQDGEFFSRVVGQSEGVLYCEDARMYYRSKIPTSITAQGKRERSLRSIYKTCESFEKVLLNLEDSTKTRLAVANKYQLFVYMAYPKCMDLVVLAERRIKELGGSNWPPYKMGKIHNLLMGAFGWKFPAYLKHLLFR